MRIPSVGTVGASYQVLVEHGKVREFATATKATHSSYWTESAPVVPPTFLIASAFWMGAGSSLLAQAKDLNWARLLSGGTEFVFRGVPPRAGDRLIAAQRMDEVYTKQGKRGGTMTFIVFTTRFRRPDGSLAAEERHTTIETSQAASADPPNSLSTGAPRHTPSRARRPTTLQTVPRAMQNGAALPEFVDEPVTRTGIVRYQGASGDFNPIHHDDEYARRSGFPTVFSVGMFHAGILGSYLADLFGPHAVRRFKVEFREQVWPDDVITYGAVVRASREGDGDKAAEIDLELAATRQSGGTHLRAWATVAV